MYDQKNKMDIKYKLKAIDHSALFPGLEESKQYSLRERHFTGAQNIVARLRGISRRWPHVYW